MTFIKLAINLAERTAVLFERAFKGAIFNQKPYNQHLLRDLPYAFIKDNKSKGIIEIDHISAAPNDIIHNGKLVKNIVIDYAPQYIVYRNDSYYNFFNGKRLQTEPINICGKFMIIEQLKTNINVIEHRGIVTFPYESVYGNFMAINFDNDSTKYRGLCFINKKTNKITHGLSYFNPQDLAGQCAVDYNARLIKIGANLYYMPDICSRRADFCIYYLNGRYYYKHPRHYVTSENYISNVEILTEVK